MQTRTAAMEAQRTLSAHSDCSPEAGSKARQSDAKGFAYGSEDASKAPYGEKREKLRLLVSYKAR